MKPSTPLPISGKPSASDFWPSAISPIVYRGLGLASFSSRRRCASSSSNVSNKPMAVSLHHAQQATDDRTDTRLTGLFLRSGRRSPVPGGAGPGGSQGSRPRPVLHVALGELVDQIVDLLL